MDYITILNNLHSFINTNIEASLWVIFVLMAIIFIGRSGKKRKLKKTNYKRVEKGFFNTGFKTATSFYDILKFKLMINDYDDKDGVNYIYLISFKILNWEVCKMKYKNQKGLVIKRNTKYTDL